MTVVALLKQREERSVDWKGKKVRFSCCHCNNKDCRRKADDNPKPKRVFAVFLRSAVAAESV